MRIIRLRDVLEGRVDESLLQQKSKEQLEMVRKMSKDTDIGDRISDMNDQGANIHYMDNVIDKNIETFQDYEAKNKSFISGWNTNHIIDPFTGKKQKK